jgi:hypothetical protein
MTLAEELHALGLGPEAISEVLDTRITTEDEASTYLVVPAPNGDIVRVLMGEDTALSARVGMRTLMPTRLALGAGPLRPASR